MLQKPTRVSTLRVRRIPSADDANPTMFKRYPTTCYHRIIEKENIHFFPPRLNVSYLECYIQTISHTKHCTATLDEANPGED
jgi:hypothetical protein